MAWGRHAALYLDNLDMGRDSPLIISTNVEVHFINSNNWSLANVQLVGNPGLDHRNHGSSNPPGEF